MHGRVNNIMDIYIYNIYIHRCIIYISIIDKVNFCSNYIEIKSTYFFLFQIIIKDFTVLKNEILAKTLKREKKFITTSPFYDFICYQKL